MYSLNDLKHAIEHPSVISRELNRIASRGEYNEKGINIFDEDWDTLIILDACRYDYFADEHNLNGNLDSRTSRGSATKEWVAGNFKNRQPKDTVYVTSNGWYERLHEDLNSSVFKYLGVYGENFIDPKTNTILPKTMSKAALDAYKNYPNKRLLIHFVQPHKPYISEKGRQAFPNSDGISMLDMLSESKAGNPYEALRTAYRENLRVVLREVKRLVGELSGKTVVSSDHGELLGDRQLRLPFRGVGHPVGVYVDTLVRVPWFVCDYGQRRKITEGKPDEISKSNERDVDAHLENLGYV